MSIETMLVPTDFSETANHAVEQAIELAIRHRSKIELFHVVEPAMDSSALTVTLGDYVHRLEDDARKSLALKVENLRGNDIDVHFSTERKLSVFEAIAAKAESLKPDLVVMGTHGRTGLNRLLIGSVAEKMLRHVPVNTLILNKKSPLARAAEAYERILAPVDFSEFSRRSVAMARSLLTSTGRLRALHVAQNPIHPSFYAGGVVEPFQVDPDLPARIEQRMKEWLDSTDVEILVEQGDAAQAVMDAAAEMKAQLIVMGTRGLSGLDHFLLGSVTERVVRGAPVAVLAVH